MSTLALIPQWHDAINQVETTEKILGGATGNANLATKQLAENILWLRQNMQAYKVGDIYTTTLDHTNAAAVATHHGYGLWERFAEGRTLVGFSTKAEDPSDYKTMGNEFGENEHTLTVSELPSHKHGITGGAGDEGSANYPDSTAQGISATTYTDNTGGDQPHNNIQQSKTLDCWKRIA